MTTQYTTILKLALPVQGELSGTWGDVVNDNITSMVEEAVAGRKVIDTWTANSHTLTSADGTTSESRAAILTLTDTGTALTGAGTVVCPAASKIYIVENSTAQVITIKTSGGTGIAVPVGKNMVVFCDGTNVEEGISNIASLSIGGDGATVTGIKDEDDMSSDSATKLATQQSIKAYVDSQVGANNELSEVLANGNTTGGTDISVSTGDDITFADSSKAIFGAGSDLQIYHDGSNSIITDQGSGTLKIQGDSQVRLESTAGERYFVGTNNGAARLYYDDTEKLATTSTGIDVTGVITTDGMTTSADVNFGDNDKAIFGAGSDLQIYHNGTESFIREVGEGGLKIDTNGPDITFRVNATETALVATSNGAVTAYYDNAQKFATTSTGIDVTGTATVSAATPSIVLSETDRTDENTQLLNASGDFRIRTRSDDGATNTDRFRIDHATGDISFYNSAGTSQSLFWDSSAESLGIGTSSVNYKLNVLADAGSQNIFQAGQTGVSNGLSITTDGSALTYSFLTGSVGIGTSSPSSLLSLLGSPVATSGALAAFRNSDATASNTSFGGVLFNSSPGTDYSIGKSNVNAVTTLSFRNGNTGASYMDIDSSGQVGIGTSSPSTRLTVGAGAGTEEIRVDAGAGWADLTLNSNATNGGHIYFNDGSNAGEIFYYHVSDYMAFNTAGTERMRIDSAGNVKINDGYLEVNTESSAAAVVRIDYNSTDSIRRIHALETGGGNARPLQIQAQDIRFRDDTTERMRIDSSGRQLIGNTASVGTAYQTNLQVKGVAGSLSNYAGLGVISTNNEMLGVVGTWSSGENSLMIAADPDNLRPSSSIVFTTDATERMRIDSSGHITSLPTYNNGSASSANMVVNSSGVFLRSVSSGKYKTNIEDVQDAYADSLLNIRPVYYRSTLENDNTEHSHWGFIAEEVAEIDPRLVHYKTVDISYSDDGERVETELETPEPEGVQYDRFAPLMLKLIQKQQATITALEARITQLENN